MTTEIQIESLLKWSEPKRVATSRGDRNLRTSIPTQAFWRIWREAKNELKEAGVSCTPDKKNSGQWIANWWQPIDPIAATKEREEKAEALEQSRATDADVQIPCPEGLAYLPYQKAGIVFALRAFSENCVDGTGLSPIP